MPAQKFFHGLMSKLYDERKDDPEAKDVGFSDFKRVRQKSP